MEAQPSPEPHMFLVIDPESDEPLREQIARQIRTRIQSGELPAGTKLVGMRKLSGKYPVSFTTVKGAYEKLQKEGFVKITPQGAYVLAQAGELDPEYVAETYRLFKRTLLGLWRAGYAHETLNEDIAKVYRSQPEE